MDKVLIQANSTAVVVYILVGVTGYLIFADRAEEQLQDQDRSRNILEADFGDSVLIQFARYLILIAVIAAAPLAILPAKHAYESLKFKHGGFSTK
jgi:amino acid permease